VEKPTQDVENATRAQKFAKWGKNALGLTLVLYILQALVGVFVGTVIGIGIGMGWW
jgi:hypothetical protein